MLTMQTILAFAFPGGWELILIVLVVLIFFGAKRIPELARGLGRGIREFKDATKEIKNDIEDGIQEEDKKKEQECHKWSHQTQVVTPMPL